MIVSFRHKGLKRFYEEDDPSRLPADMIERIRGILTLLDHATNLSQVNRPTLRMHPLKGDLYALTVRANWRILFRFDGVNVRDVNFVDYH